jgi:hypothetical protein
MKMKSKGYMAGGKTKGYKAGGKDEDGREGRKTSSILCS